MRELKPEGVIYRIESAVGQGLSSTVYKAVREDSQGFSRQLVALKVLRSQTAVSWLRREFQTLERVRSPHCVKVLAWENLPEGCALVLEWIDGMSLLDLARSTRLEEGLILEILAQVQEGLRAVDREGLHHGDLSPANILIDRGGLVRILDFGIDPDETAALHGTPAYIAPELWEGRKSSISSDLFSLGLIEHDLKSVFKDIPITSMQARERSFRLASRGGSWLNAKPTERRFIEMPLNESNRFRLALLVQERLNERENQLKTTRMPHEEPKFAGERRRRSNTAKGSWRIGLLAAVWIFCLTLPGLADAPPEKERPKKEQPKKEQQEARAELQIRSLNWIRIKINGIDAGYAPLALKGLKSGSHRVSWASAKGRGELILKLPPGGRVLLKEEDLAQRQSTGKD